MVYSPWRNELYTALKGKGAFCNGKPIHVSDRPFEKGLLFTAMSLYRKDLAKACSDVIYDLYMECNDVRRTGSAAVELCLMAAGFAGSVCGFDGGRPSPYKPSMYIAANSIESCQKIHDVVRRYVSVLPY